MTTIMAGKLNWLGTQLLSRFARTESTAAMRVGNKRSFAIGVRPKVKRAQQYPI
jgi:hypothetical protein